MKICAIALLGAAALAFAGPAVAGDVTGWYFDAAGGWDHMDGFKLQETAPSSAEGKIDAGDTALVTGGWGYRFENHIRLEGEIGWDDHNIGANNQTPVTGGHVQVLSFLANAAYDVPLSNRWNFSFGGGVGVGVVDWKLDNSADIPPSSSSTNFMWQGFAGVSYSITRNLDLTLDYRYRSLSVSKDYSVAIDGCEGTSPVTADIRAAATAVGSCTGNASVKGLNEQAVMVGIRWYPWAAPPPPPPLPPPPPPPAPPPPVTTFIVFFDFNKSDLTAEAQSVVTEAVKVAKEDGFVKILVTGHTDTVGSDSYNQGLSVRRAESVKDEMVRQGLDGSGIAIEGKSFHDPLVPTGPGVREPQNRRAVIDLGK